MYNKVTGIQKTLIFVVALCVFYLLPFPTYAFNSPSFSLLQISSFFQSLATFQDSKLSMVETQQETIQIPRYTNLTNMHQNNAISPLEVPYAETIQSGPIIGYPYKITIPSLGISSNIEKVGYTMIEGSRTWAVPTTSAGTPSDQVKNNVILIGHTGVYASVFEQLKNISQGASIKVTNDSGTYSYIVTESTTVNLRNLRYIMPQDSPTLTLITCVANDSSLRRIVVAIHE